MERVRALSRDPINRETGKVRALSRDPINRETNRRWWAEKNDLNKRFRFLELKLDHIYDASRGNKDLGEYPRGSYWQHLRRGVADEVANGQLKF